MLDAGLGVVNLGTKDGGLSAGVILFGQKGNPKEPQTRPGHDGKVSCSSCSPEEGIRNSFGRDPTEDDYYWGLDVDKVKSSGGNVEFDAGQPVTDLNGNMLGGNYPEGHVSVFLNGQSKGWVERTLRALLGPAFPVLP